MKNRLTQPMRRVLQNLADGKPLSTGLIADHATNSVTGALRKRGYISMKPDATFAITPQGRAPLADNTTKDH